MAHYEGGRVSESYEKHALAVTPAPPKFDPEAYGAKRRGCAPLTVANILIGVGVLVAAFGITYGVAFPAYITNTIDNGVATCETADIQKEAFLDSYGDCKDCTPYYYSLYMFNVTNAMDYLENGAKLKVQEVGPYTYRKRQIKVDVNLSDDASTITYKQYTYHTFYANMSCDGCSDSDNVVSFDTGYLNVISQSGGETGFLTKLVSGTLWGAALTETDLAATVQANKTTLMKYVNGLNSNQPAAWKKLGATVMSFLAVGLTPLEGLELEGFEYNGIFAARPISDWALGFPGFLAGLGLGTNYVNTCTGTSGTLAKCASCSGSECLELYASCKKCKTGAAVVALNALTCGKMVAKYAAVYGETEAATAVNSTCSLCSSFGVCMAPMPGIVQGDGMDYSTTAPDSSSLSTYIQKTGCSNFSAINEFVEYDGDTETALWAKLDSRRNPTLAEMNAFASYGNCASPTANLTCSVVTGNDGTSTPPGGATIMGFPSKVELESSSMYLDSAKQTITLENTGETNDDLGATVTRFIPPSDLLSYSDAKGLYGLGVPVDGVMSLGFVSNLLAYLSYPMFLWGDDSLYEGVEITMFDGTIASSSALFESDGSLKSDYYERYQTYVDYEPGTGKAIRARKRLQASFALANSTWVPGSAMSDVLYPDLAVGVIMPSYYGAEASTITDSKMDTLKGILTILKTLLPGLICGIVIGLGIFAWGIVKRRNARAAHMSRPYGNSL